MSGMQCAASMCPLIAKEGSPWTGEKASPCPCKGWDGSYGDILHTGCPWWDMGCGHAGMQFLVDKARESSGRACVAGPNRPRRHEIGTPRSYDCAKEAVCSWHKQSLLAGHATCAPRTALAEGIDPRVVLF